MCCDGLFMAAIAAVMAVRYDDGLQERNKRRESGEVSYASQDALERHRTRCGGLVERQLCTAVSVPGVLYGAITGAVGGHYRWPGRVGHRAATGRQPAGSPARASHGPAWSAAG